MPRKCMNKEVTKVAHLRAAHDLEKEVVVLKMGQIQLQCSALIAKGMPLDLSSVIWATEARISGVSTRPEHQARVNQLVEDVQKCARKA